MKTVFYIVIGVQLTLIVGLRDWESCGIDLYRYYKTYDYLVNGSLDSSFDIREGSSILFFLTMALCSKIGISYQTFVSIISIIFIITIIVLYKKKTNYPLISIFLFLGMGVFVFSFSGLKQVIAMTLVIWSYILFESENKIIAYVLLFCAMLYHPTAIIFLPFLLVKNIPVTKIILIISMVVFSVFLVFRMQIGLFLTLLYAEEYADRYESTGSLTSTALFMIILFLLLLFYKPRNKKYSFVVKKSYFTSFYILYFAVLIQICSSFAYSFTRLNYFYMLFLPIAVSNIIDFSKQNKFLSITGIKYALFSIVIIALMYKLYMGGIESEELENYKFLIKI